MYCSKCGSEIADNCKFCSKCGMEIKSEFSGNKKIGAFDFTKVMKSKKQIAIAAGAIIAIVLTIVMLLSLGADSVSKKQICDDVSAFAGFKDYDLEIVEYDEEKRDTNEENQYDQIWVNVIAENEDIRFTGSYILMYKLYNEGWELEYIDPINHDYSAVQELDESRIKEDILSEYDDLVQTYHLEDVHIDMPLPLDTTTLKTIDLRCVATAKNDQMTVEGIVDVTYELKMDFSFCGWMLTKCKMGTFSYAATTEPSEELLSDATADWESGFTLLERQKTNENEYTYKYNRTDSKTYKGIKAEWNTSLVVAFSLDSGWHFRRVDNELINATVTAKGTWTYENEDGERCTIKVNSANENKINFDVSITWVPSSFGSLGTPQTFEKKGMEMTWAYTYIYNDERDSGSITFATDECVTSFESSFLFSSFAPKLEYVAYETQDNSRTSGYRLDYWQLEEQVQTTT